MAAARCGSPRAAAEASGSSPRAGASHQALSLARAGRYLRPTASPRAPWPTQPPGWMRWPAICPVIPTGRNLRAASRIRPRQKAASSGSGSRPPPTQRSRPRLQTWFGQSRRRLEASVMAFPRAALTPVRSAVRFSSSSFRAWLHCPSLTNPCWSLSTSWASRSRRISVRATTCARSTRSGCTRARSSASGTTTTCSSRRRFLRPHRSSARSARTSTPRATSTWSSSRSRIRTTARASRRSRFRWAWTAPGCRSACSSWGRHAANP